VKPLSGRAKARLKRARLLLQAEPQRFGLPRGWKLDAPTGPYEAIQAALEGLSPQTRDELRGLVDWVEDYEQSEPPAERPKMGASAPAAAVPPALPGSGV
jgi:hypothetical protein